MFAAIILAAGASERMGYPKALLPYRGRPFLSGIVDACYAAGVEKRVVVLGHYADKIKEEIDLSDLLVAVNEDLDTGPIGSVRAGLAALAPYPVDAILVWPVDRPHVAVATIEALLDGFRSSHQPIVVPTHAGRRGHPRPVRQARVCRIARCPGRRRRPGCRPQGPGPRRGDPNG